MRCDRCGLKDRRPARDLGLHEGVELPRRALVLGRDRAAEIGETLLHARVIERLVERARELLDGTPFGAKIPAQMLI